MIDIWILGIVIVIAVLIAVSYAAPAFFGAPVAYTTPEKIKAMLKLSRDVTQKRVIDLGSGDGRVLLAYGKEGAEVIGYEINPLLVWYSRVRLRRAGIDASVRHKSFWSHDLSSYDVVLIYGVSYIMPKIAKKLKKELQPGTRVISNYFQLPDWEHVEEEGGVYCYIAS